MATLKVKGHTRANGTKVKGHTRTLGKKPAGEKAKRVGPSVKKTMNKARQTVHDKLAGAHASNEKHAAKAVVKPEGHRATQSHIKKMMKGVKSGDKSALKEARKHLRLWGM